MQRRTRALAAVVGAAVAVSTMTACQPNPTTSSEGGKSRDRLTLSIQSDFGGWDPSKMLGAGPVTWIEHAVYDRVLNCNSVGELEPGVAEKWEFNDAKTELTLHIRPGMTFSDGTAVNAEAVKTSIDYIVEGSKGASRIANTEVKVVDDLTAVMTVPEANPLLPTWLCLAEGTVVSPEYIKSGKLDDAPVGSGPYTFDAARSTAGSEYVFTKNDKYWDSENFPYKELGVKVIKDPTATVNALKTGQIDGTTTGQDTAKEIQAAAGLKQLSLQGAWAGLLITDRNGKIIPALANAEVRRAINMVFDREGMAKAIYGATATPTGQIFRQGSDAYIENLQEPYPFDVDAAKALMTKAGFADGFDIEIPFVAGFGWEKELPVVIQQLSLLNIRAKQTTLTGPNAISDLISGRFPVIFWPLGNNGNSLVDIQNTISPEGIWNVQDATDPKVSELLEKINTTSGDESQKLQQELNRYVIDQAWFAPVVYPTTYFSYSTDKVTVEESSDINALAPNLRDFR